jgi:ribA/ribD-fused uncharacterized protein
MMACKAWLFDRDPKASVLRSILASKKPYEQKALGRKVPGFINSIWQAASSEIVIASQITRAEVDQHLAEIYLKSDKILVEGSPADKIWGVGLHWKGTAIEDERNWIGENRLGWCHGLARKMFREERKIQLRAMTSTRNRTSTHSNTTTNNQSQPIQNMQDGEIMEDHSIMEVAESSDSDGDMTISESLDSDESFVIVDDVDAEEDGVDVN